MSSLCLSEIKPRLRCACSTSVSASESSHLRGGSHGAYLTVCLCGSGNRPSVRVRVILTSRLCPPAFLLQHIPRRTAVAGRGGDAPGRQAGGGGRRLVAERRQPREVTLRDGTCQNPLWMMTDLRKKNKKTSLQKTLQGMH